MKVLALRGRLDDAGSDDPIAKVLALVSLPGILLDHGLENGKDFFLGDRGSVEFVDSLSMVAAAEVEVVMTTSVSEHVQHEHKQGIMTYP